MASSLGVKIGRGLRKTGDEMGKFTRGFSEELGIKHGETTVSVGESAGKVSAVIVASPFRFMRDIINGVNGVDDTPAPAAPERANIVDHTFQKAAV